MNAKDLIEMCKGYTNDALRGVVIPSVWMVEDVEQCMDSQGVKRDAFTYDEKVAIMERAADLFGDRGDTAIHDSIYDGVEELAEKKKGEREDEMLDGDDALSRWGGYGPHDLDEEADKWLRDALASGKWFDSGWHGFSKETCEMRVTRDGSGVKVEVCASMDDLDDYTLIMDCLTDEEQVRMTEEMCGRVAETLFQDETFTTETERSSDCMENPTVEQVMEKASDLLRECDAKLIGCFTQCKEAALRVLYEGDERLDEILKDRLCWYDGNNGQKENEQ